MELACMLSSTIGIISCSYSLPKGLWFNFFWTILEGALNPPLAIKIIIKQSTSLGWDAHRANQPWNIYILNFQFFYAFIDNSITLTMSKKYISVWVKKERSAYLDPKQTKMKLSDQSH